MIDEHHTGLVQFKCAVCHQYRLTERHFCAKKRFCLNILFFAAPHAILKFFSEINANDILSLNQIKTTSTGNSFEQLCLEPFCFGQFFSRRLL